MQPLVAISGTAVFKKTSLSSLANCETGNKLEFTPDSVELPDGFKGKEDITEH